MFKSGFISIVGRPNVGKSTLVNKLVGSKVSITSNKVQTTRNNICGVVNNENYQLVFVDTPGIHKPKGKFGELLNDSAMDSLVDCDLIIFIVEANSKFGVGDKRILEVIKNKKAPIFLVVNKIDSLTQNIILKKLTEFNEVEGIKKVIPISAKTGKNVDVLKTQILNFIPEGPRYFEKNVIVDKRSEFMLAELIREQVLDQTKEEVPHSVATIIEKMTFNRKKDIWIISGLIFVERESQKKIIVGKAGKMISTISRKSRYQFEKYLCKNVHLTLLVKVEKKWKSAKDIIKIYGY